MKTRYLAPLSSPVRHAFALLETYKRLFTCSPNTSLRTNVTTMGTETHKSLPHLQLAMSATPALFPSPSDNSKTTLSIPVSVSFLKLLRTCQLTSSAVSVVPPPQTLHLLRCSTSNPQACNNPPQNPSHPTQSSLCPSARASGHNQDTKTSVSSTSRLAIVKPPVRSFPAKRIQSTKPPGCFPKSSLARPPSATPRNHR